MDSVIVSVIAGLALAAAAGLRAFLPLLVLSVTSRMGLLELHEGFRFLGSDVALVALIVATILELGADKIPVVDHILDLASTFVRPLAGLFAGLAVMADLPQPIPVALGLLFTVVALGTHAGKAKTRLGSTVTTAGIGNPVLSVIEDFLSSLFSILAIVAPIIAGILVLCFLWLVWRGIRRMRTRRAG